MKCIRNKKTNKQNCNEDPYRLLDILNYKRNKLLINNEDIDPRKIIKLNQIYHIMDKVDEKIDEQNNENVQLLQKSVKKNLRKIKKSKKFFGLKKNTKRSRHKKLKKKRIIF